MGGIIPEVEVVVADEKLAPLAADRTSPAQKVVILPLGLPAIALGPVVEHLAMLAGTTF